MIRPRVFHSVSSLSLLPGRRSSISIGTVIHPMPSIQRRDSAVASYNWMRLTDGGSGGYTITKRRVSPACPYTQKHWSKGKCSTH